jgi:hypothetical protein
VFRHIIFFSFIFFSFMIFTFKIGLEGLRRGCLLDRGLFYICGLGFGKELRAKILQNGRVLTWEHGKRPSGSDHEVIIAWV